MGHARRYQGLEFQQIFLEATIQGITGRCTDTGLRSSQHSTGSQEVLNVSSSLAVISDMNRSQDGHSLPLLCSTSLSALLTDCLIMTFTIKTGLLRAGCSQSYLLNAQLKSNCSMTTSTKSSLCAQGRCAGKVISLRDPSQTCSSQDLGTASQCAHVDIHLHKMCKNKI